MHCAYDQDREINRRSPTEHSRGGFEYRPKRYEWPKLKELKNELQPSPGDQPAGHQPRTRYTGLRHTRIHPGDVQSRTQS